jgi:hypothetical protein
MAYSDAPGRTLTPVKVLVGGGFGAGKTTFVGTVSEVDPLSAEELITEASADVDSLDGVEGKTTTTVAFDFGRLSVSNDLVLYLFGMPGQERFWFMWDEFSAGALGAVVLVDPRRLEGCFPVLDFFERRDIKFVVAVNEFGGAEHTLDEIRAALDLKPHIPMTQCDARDPKSTAATLVILVRHLLESA